MPETLYIVVPCYNEEAVLPETAARLSEKLSSLVNSGSIADESRIVFINDGSKDRTWEVISELHETEKRFCGVSLSRNRGHQNALLCGLMYAKEHADIIVSMDADLQDDIDAIDLMLEKRAEGCDIVYGVRNSRKKDTAFKKTTAQGYYKLLKLMGCEIVYNHADFRLTSKRVLESLSDYHEVNLFLRGMFPMIGFKSDTVSYERHERFAGESKYPLSKMLAFALEGVTSLTVKPIRFITFLGLLIFLVSIVMLIYFLVTYLCGKTVQGWTTIVISIWAIGGLQLLALGVIGEYIGKIYLEAKSRPKYHIDKILD